ncbi:MAG TPA: flagellar protein FlhE [Alcanivorax sp.]|nr:flagellar protein FlhE [Alcanivorax sp.]
MNRLVGVLLVLLGSPALAAPGSWQAPLPEMRLAVAGRFYHSEPATPPPMAEGKAIVRVGWRYRVPAGRRVQAWLCQDGQCLPLGTARRGRFLAPPDWRVSRPLHLRFRLPAGESRAVTVATPRLTVEYR